MSITYPHCGALQAEGETCEERFNLGQFKEVEQPAYYTVHQLSVPCYMLQHNRYSRPGWIHARELLRQFLQEALSPERARRQNKSAVDSGNRTWSITRGPKLPGVEAIKWSRSIADVRLDTPEIYCADVRLWAASIIKDSEQLVRESGPA